MPHVPNYKKDAVRPYSTSTGWEHLISEYSGISMYDIQSLPLDEYFILRRDAFIHQMEQTEEGREYLNTAHRLEQTEPDRTALRRKLKRGGE